MLLLLKCLFRHLESQLCGKAWLGDQTAHTNNSNEKQLGNGRKTKKTHENSNWNVKDPKQI